MTNKRLIRGLYCVLTILLLGAVPRVASAGGTETIFFEDYYHDALQEVVEGDVAVFHVLAENRWGTFGGVAWEVTWDPTQAELVGVEPGWQPERPTEGFDWPALGTELIWRASPGRLVVVNLNGESLIRPSGFVSVGRVFLRPLGPVGDRVAVGLVALEAVTTASESVSLRSYSGNIRVISGKGGGKSSAAATGPEPPSDSAERGRQWEADLRPEEGKARERVPVDERPRPRAGREREVLIEPQVN